MDASILKTWAWKLEVLKFFRVITFGTVLWNGSAFADSAKDCFFKTSDGLRLHYVEAGKGDQTIVFVPGWMMPASVFDAQVRELSKRHRVVAFDPRSQGKSEVFHGPHSPERRCKDLHELLRAAKADKPILAGWSLGVMEVLDYLAHYKPANLAGLVLIDNSIGEGGSPGASSSAPPPKVRSTKPAPEPDPDERTAYLRRFTLGLTKKPMPPQMFDSIFASARQVPYQAARELINKPYPREYWRDTLLAQKVPILYAVRPRFEGQGKLLCTKRPGQAQMEVFSEAGHALFIDEPARFNRLLGGFAERAWAAPLAGRER
jgi:microsomal epoxide hydrolase